MRDQSTIQSTVVERQPTLKTENGIHQERSASTL